jgi:hypothetical protein
MVTIAQNLDRFQGMAVPLEGQKCNADYWQRNGSGIESGIQNRQATGQDGTVLDSANDRRRPSEVQRTEQLGCGEPDRPIATF